MRRKLRCNLFSLIRLAAIMQPTRSIILSARVTNTTSIIFWNFFFSSFFRPKLKSIRFSSFSIIGSGSGLEFPTCESYGFYFFFYSYFYFFSSIAFSSYQRLYTRSSSFSYSAFGSSPFLYASGTRRSPIFLFSKS